MYLPNKLFTLFILQYNHNVSHTLYGDYYDYNLNLMTYFTYMSIKTIKYLKKKTIEKWVYVKDKINVNP